jgi:hypothetical protein
VRHGRERCTFVGLYRRGFIFSDVSVGSKTPTSPSCPRAPSPTRPTYNKRGRFYNKYDHSVTSRRKTMSGGRITISRTIRQTISDTCFYNKSNNEAHNRAYTNSHHKVRNKSWCKDSSHIQCMWARRPHPTKPWHEGLLYDLLSGTLGLMVGLIVSAIVSRRAQAPERAP